MSEPTSSVAVLFPGQGSQYPGMADGWTENPLSKTVLDEASEVIGYDIVAGCHDEKLLASTNFVQPALVACEIAAFRLLDDAKLPIAATAGHSLGEFSSLVAADVISLKDVLRIINVRGKAMQEASRNNPGTMTALLKINALEAAKLCLEAAQDDELVVANFNMPAQTVISGTVSAIERAEVIANDCKIRAVRLPVAGAFHSALMKSAVRPINSVLNTIEMRDPIFPIAENVSGKIEVDADTLRSNLERHVVSSVKWEQSIRALGVSGITTFIEAGPGKVLSGFTKRILPDAKSFNASSPEEIESIVESLG